MVFWGILGFSELQYYLTTELLGLFICTCYWIIFLLIILLIILLYISSSFFAHVYSLRGLVYEYFCNCRPSLSARHECLHLLILKGRFLMAYENTNTKKKTDKGLRRKENTCYSLFFIRFFKSSIVGDSPPKTRCSIE